MRRDDFDTERHRLEQVLDILERAADRLAAHGPVRSSLLRDAVAFIRATEASAYDASQEDVDELPLSDCVAQHAAARIPLAAMERALPDAEHGAPAAAAAFVGAARDYVRLRREHLRADDRLFMSASSRLAPSTAAQADVEAVATRECYQRLLKDAAALDNAAPSR